MQIQTSQNYCAIQRQKNQRMQQTSPNFKAIHITALIKRDVGYLYDIQTNLREKGISSSLTQVLGEAPILKIKGNEADAIKEIRKIQNQIPPNQRRPITVKTVDDSGVKRLLEQNQSPYAPTARVNPWQTKG